MFEFELTEEQLNRIQNLDAGNGLLIDDPTNEEILIFNRLNRTEIGLIKVQRSYLRHPNPLPEEVVSNAK